MQFNMQIEILNALFRLLFVTQCSLNFLFRKRLLLKFDIVFPTVLSNVICIKNWCVHDPKNLILTKNIFVSAFFWCSGSGLFVSYLFSIRKNNFNRENISIHKIWNFIKYKILANLFFLLCLFCVFSCALYLLLIS